MKGNLNWYIELVMNYHTSWHDQICMKVYTSLGLTVLWKLLQLWSNPVIPSSGSALYSSLKKENDTKWLSETKVTFQNADIKICLFVQNLECLFNKFILPPTILLLLDRCALKNQVNVSHVVSTYLETYEVHLFSGNACWQLFFSGNAHWQLSDLKVHVHEEQTLCLLA
jgi:hypothetical protein